MKYFDVIGYIDGVSESLYGSFDRLDCKYELEAERDSWKEAGYKKLKIVSRETSEKPDSTVYGNLVSFDDVDAIIESKNDGELIDYINDGLITKTGDQYFVNDSQLLNNIKKGLDWDQKIVDLKIWGLKHNDKNMFDRVNYFLNKGIEHMEYKDYSEFNCTCKEQYIYQEAAFLKDIN